MVQLILNPAYLPITDVSEIGLFGEILSDESVGVLIDGAVAGRVFGYGIVRLGAVACSPW